MGNAQLLKQLEMVETSLRENTKIVLTEHGINPTLLVGSLPFNVSSEDNGHERMEVKIGAIATESKT
jgi:hypothetical protein